MEYHERSFIKQEPYGLFEPDVLVCAEFWGAYTKRAELPPEQQLMAAVLEDAIDCFQKHFRERDATFKEAEEWILKEQSRELFSFENICDELHLNPQRIRRALLRWKAAQGRTISPPPHDNSKRFRAAPRRNP